MSKSAGRLKGEGRVTEPKTVNSIRTICLPKGTVDILIQEHAKHPENSYIFSSPVMGKMYGPDCMGRLHKTLLMRARINENIRFHEVRHSFICFDKLLATVIIYYKIFKKLLRIESCSHCQPQYFELVDLTRESRKTFSYVNAKEKSQKLWERNKSRSCNR